MRYSIYLYFFFFFFQAEDGIRDYTVTGVQTCALPIYALGASMRSSARSGPSAKFFVLKLLPQQRSIIGNSARPSASPCSASLPDRLNRSGDHSRQRPFGRDLGQASALSRDQIPFAPPNSREWASRTLARNGV